MWLDVEAWWHALTWFDVTCVLELEKAVSAHLAMQALYSYRQAFGVYPESNNLEQLEQMLALMRLFRQLVRRRC